LKKMAAAKGKGDRPVEICTVGFKTKVLQRRLRTTPRGKGGGRGQVPTGRRCLTQKMTARRGVLVSAERARGINVIAAGEVEKKARSQKETTTEDENIYNKGRQKRHRPPRVEISDSRR